MVASREERLTREVEGRGDFRNTARVRLRIRQRVSGYSGGRAKRALSAGEGRGV